MQAPGLLVFAQPGDELSKPDGAVSFVFLDHPCDLWYFNLLVELLLFGTYSLVYVLEDPLLSLEGVFHALQPFMVCFDEKCAVFLFFSTRFLYVLEPLPTPAYEVLVNVFAYE